MKTSRVLLSVAVVVFTLAILPLLVQAVVIGYQIAPFVRLPIHRRTTFRGIDIMLPAMWRETCCSTSLDLEAFPRRIFHPYDRSTLSIHSFPESAIDSLADRHLWLRNHGFEPFSHPALGHENAIRFGYSRGEFGMQGWKCEEIFPAAGPSKVLISCLSDRDDVTLNYGGYIADEAGLRAVAAQLHNAGK